MRTFRTPCTAGKRVAAYVQATKLLQIAIRNSIRWQTLAFAGVFEKVLTAPKPASTCPDTACMKLSMKLQRDPICDRTATLSSIRDLRNLMPIATR